MRWKSTLLALLGKAEYSLWNTLRVNYRLFPREVARLLPVKAGRHLDLKGLHRGSIVFREGIQPHKFMFRLGVSPWTLYSNKSMHTLCWFHAGAQLVVGDETDINSGCRLVITTKATVELGDHFFINQNSLIYCSRSIRFGQHCTLGWDCQVYDSDFHLCADARQGIVRNPVRPIVVGDDVWVANRCTLAKGTVIPSHSVVASHSLVTGDLSRVVADDTSCGHLFAGIPATLRRSGIMPISDNRTEAKLRRHFFRTDADFLPL